MKCRCWQTWLEFRLNYQNTTIVKIESAQKICWHLGRKTDSIGLNPTACFWIPKHDGRRKWTLWLSYRWRSQQMDSRTSDEGIGRSLCTGGKQGILRWWGRKGDMSSSHTVHCPIWSVSKTHFGRQRAPSRLWPLVKLSLPLVCWWCTMTTTCPFLPRLS